jgi:hypothetical protein
MRLRQWFIPLLHPIAALVAGARDVLADIIAAGQLAAIAREHVLHDLLRTTGGLSVGRLIRIRRIKSRACGRRSAARSITDASD